MLVNNEQVKTTEKHCFNYHKYCDAEILCSKVLFLKQFKLGIITNYFSILTCKYVGTKDVTCFLYC